MNNCKKCNEPIDGNYCSNCGQPAKLKRIDGHYVFREIGGALSIDGKIFYTVKGMFLSPGETVKRFITEDRSRYINPITFIIATSLIYTLICHLFNVQYAEQLGTETSAIVFINRLQEYSGYANIIIGIFVAFWIKIFFRKSGYNLSEILVLLCFVFGIEMLISSVFVIIQGLTHSGYMQIASLIVIIYFTWATGQFFDGKKARSYIKALIAYLLGMFVFLVLLILVGSFIDIILKH